MDRRHAIRSRLLSSVHWAALDGVPKKMSRYSVTVIALVATLVMWPLAAAAQLNVLISGGFSGPYERPPGD